MVNNNFELITERVLGWHKTFIAHREFLGNGDVVHSAYEAWVSTGEHKTHRTTPDFHSPQGMEELLTALSRTHRVTFLSNTDYELQFECRLSTGHFQFFLGWGRSIPTALVNATMKMIHESK